VAQHLKTLLNGNQELRPLMANVHALSDLQRHFASIAPAHLVQASQIQVLSLNLGTLSIAVANATAAAKLRQLAPELVVLMQNKGCEVSGIRVKVQVSFDRLQRKSAPHKLSKAAQNALNELSLNLNDSPLKVALERMAKIKS
jgi:isopentenyl diphosphate isomerase/L-lactate dehydrogenase-like FMN-dependent dehydrogenase